jgi:hypothetical protein
MGHYVRKTKMVNGKAVNIDKWFSNMADAKRYAKLVDGFIYDACKNPNITNTAQVWA